MGLLPSITVLLIVAVSFSIFFRIAASRWFGGQNHDNLERFQQWAKSNRKKAIFLFHLPTLLFFSPSWEELVYRAPLIVFFGTISGFAWLGIIVSAIAFSIIHYRSPLNKGMAQAERKVDGRPSNEGKLIKKIGIDRTIISFVLGILLGYLGIRYQSLWLCAGIHAGWNYAAPYVLPVLISRIKFIVKQRDNTAN